MEINVLFFKDYKEFLNEWIQGQPSRGRGVRSALARAAGCQAAYVSQVLSGKQDFGLEQAQAISKHIGLSQDETHCFLLLVQKARAGTRELREYFQSQLDALRQERLLLKNRLGVQSFLEKENQLIYYSSWLYAAIHVITDIPAFQTREAIAEKFSLPLGKVADILEFLEKTGLIVRKDNRFQMGEGRIHLGSDSALIAKHHANWRMKAIASMDLERPDDLHYSSVVSISEKDSVQIKSAIVAVLKNIKTVIKDSRSEELFSLSFDFFRV